MKLEEWRKYFDDLDNGSLQDYLQYFIKNCPAEEQNAFITALKKDIKIWKEEGHIPKSFELCTKKYLDK